MIIDTKNDDQGRMKQEAIKLRGQDKKKFKDFNELKKEDPKKNQEKESEVFDEETYIMRLPRQSLSETPIHEEIQTHPQPRV